jgi:hypothetical protein
LGEIAMSRVRMSWVWVGKFPIFVYTSYIDNKKFHVKVIKGKKGDQNAGGTGPRDKAWFEYECVGIISKDGVVADAFERVKVKLEPIKKLYASVLLLDNKIINWKVGSNKWDSPYIVSVRSGMGITLHDIHKCTTETIQYAVLSDVGNRRVFEVQSTRWFRNWEMSPLTSAMCPYE